MVLGLLYSADVEPITDFIYTTERLAKSTDQTQAAAAGREFLAAERQAEENKEEEPAPEAAPADEAQSQLQFLTSHLGVACTDGAQPSARTLSRYAATYTQQYPHFGESWIWNSASCSAPRWQAHDEDAYRGPFNQHTAAPVLVVGNEFDPATNVGNAVESAQMLPNSQLVFSNNWGHVAYGKSECATQAIDSYLINPQATGSNEPIECKDGAQPFS